MARSSALPGSASSRASKSSHQLQQWSRLTPGNCSMPRGSNSSSMCHRSSRRRRAPAATASAAAAAAGTQLDFDPDQYWLSDSDDEDDYVITARVPPQPSAGARALGQGHAASSALASPTPAAAAADLPTPDAQQRQHQQVQQVHHRKEQVHQTHQQRKQQVQEQKQQKQEQKQHKQQQQQEQHQESDGPSLQDSDPLEVLAAATVAAWGCLLAALLAAGRQLAAGGRLLARTALRTALAVAPRGARRRLRSLMAELPDGFWPKLHWLWERPLVRSIRITASVANWGVRLPALAALLATHGGVLVGQLSLPMLAPLLLGTGMLLRSIKTNASYVIPRVGLLFVLLWCIWAGNSIIQNSWLLLRRQGQLDARVCSVLHTLTECLALMLASIVVLSSLGVNISGLLLPAGVCVAIASKDVLQNALAGFFLFLAQPFRIGNKVGVVCAAPGADAAGAAGSAAGSGWFEGVCEQVDLRYTVLRSGKRRLMVPNTAFVSREFVVWDDVPDAHGLTRGGAHHAGAAAGRRGGGGSSGGGGEEPGGVKALREGHVATEIPASPLPLPLPQQQGLLGGLQVPLLVPLQVPMHPAAVVHQQQQLYSSHPEALHSGGADAASPAAPQGPQPQEQQQQHAPAPHLHTAGFVYAPGGFTPLLQQHHAYGAAAAAPAAYQQVVPTTLPPAGSGGGSSGGEGGSAGAGVTTPATGPTATAGKSLGLPQPPSQPPPQLQPAQLPPGLHLLQLGWQEQYPAPAPPPSAAAAPGGDGSGGSQWRASGATQPPVHLHLHPHQHHWQPQQPQQQQWQPPPLPQQQQQPTHQGEQHLQHQHTPGAPLLQQQQQAHAALMHPSRNGGSAFTHSSTQHHSHVHNPPHTQPGTPPDTPPTTPPQHPIHTEAISSSHSTSVPVAASLPHPTSTPLSAASHASHDNGGGPTHAAAPGHGPQPAPGTTIQGSAPNRPHDPHPPPALTNALQPTTPPHAAPGPAPLPPPAPAAAAAAHAAAHAYVPTAAAAAPAAAPPPPATPAHPATQHAPLAALPPPAGAAAGPQAGGPGLCAAQLPVGALAWVGCDTGAAPGAQPPRAPAVLPAVAPPQRGT